LEARINSHAPRALEANAASNQKAEASTTAMTWKLMDPLNRGLCGMEDGEKGREFKHLMQSW